MKLGMVTSEAIAKVLQDNLYAKIDENTFGMN